MFIFTLALALGRTVEELLDTVSYEELLRWGELNAISPIGEWRADVRSAQIVAMMANINRDTKRHPEPFQIKEFLLFDKPKPVEHDPKDGAHIKPELMAWLFAKSRGKAV